MRNKLEDFYIRTYASMIPFYSHGAFSGINMVRDTSGYVKYSNWSYEFRRSIRQSFSTNEEGSHFDRAVKFASGSGIFFIRKGMLISLNTNKILLLTVVLAGGHRMILVSDEFDTAKCQIAYKTLRKHWRSVMYDLIWNNNMIVKVPQSTLDGFMVKLNYVPAEKEFKVLDRRIRRLATNIDA